MKIFIDVGGHFGETIEAVIDPVYGFDKIYCFEPVKLCAERIKKIKSDKLIVITAGLYNKNTTCEIYKPGSEAASIFSDHEGLRDDKLRDVAFEEIEICKLIKSSEFFLQNIKTTDYVVMKLNCEGSECDILLDLIESEEICKVKNLLVDFDARKIPSQFHKIDIVKEILKVKNIKYFSPEEMQYGGGTHFGGIRQWLRRTNQKEINIFSIFKYLAFHFKNIISLKHMPFYKLQLLKITPVFITNLYYKIKS